MAMASVSRPTASPSARDVPVELMYRYAGLKASFKGEGKGAEGGNIHGGRHGGPPPSGQPPVVGPLGAQHPRTAAKGAAAPLRPTQKGALKPHPV